MPYRPNTEEYKACRVLPVDFEDWTWGHIQHFLYGWGFADDEYVSLNRQYESPKDKDYAKAVERARAEKVWANNVWTIDVTWKPGANEGYYVHAGSWVRQNDSRENAYQNKLTCKFWQAHRAEWCANLLTRVLFHNGVQMNYDHLLPKFFRGDEVVYENQRYEVCDTYADGRLDLLLLNYSPRHEITIRADVLTGASA